MTSPLATLRMRVRTRFRSITFVLLAACVRPAPDLATSYAGVPGAEALEGVRSEMRLADLRRVHPAVRVDSGVAREVVGPYHVDYSVASDGADSTISFIELSREFTTADSSAAAWHDAVKAARRQLGDDFACDTMPTGTRADVPSFRTARWSEVPSALSVISGPGGLRFLKPRGERRDTGRRQVVTLFITRHSAFEAALGGIVGLFSPRTTGVCRTMTQENGSGFIVQTEAR